MEDYCSAGLQPSGEPERDVHRLGVVCGAPTGLEPLAPAHTRTFDEPATIATHRLERAECVRVIAASSSDEAIDLEWKAQGDVLAHCQLKRLGLCPERAALCPEVEGARLLEVELVLSNPLEVGVALRLWRRKDR
nr:hypothetical protein [uncultured bacterium]